MTKVKIWLVENRNVIFSEDKTFDEIVADIFAGKIFLLIKKDKISLAVNTNRIILVEELKEQ